MAQWFIVLATWVGAAFVGRSWSCPGCCCCRGVCSYRATVAALWWCCGGGGAVVVVVMIRNDAFLLLVPQSGALPSIHGQQFSRTILVMLAVVGCLILLDAVVVLWQVLMFS